MGSWPWNASARSETRPGRVKGGSPPGDHRAGDPPSLAGAAGPDLPARLPVLPGSLEAITGDVNGVVLGRIVGRRLSDRCGAAIRFPAGDETVEVCPTLDTLVLKATAIVLAARWLPGLSPH